MMEKDDLYKNYLPRDVMIKILCGVGEVRSTVRSKVVSKEWRDVVESPDFAYHYLSEGDRRRHLLVFTNRRPNEYKILAFEDENCSNPAAAAPPAPPNTYNYDIIKDVAVINSGLIDEEHNVQPLVGNSVDGLVLLMLYEEMYKYVLICNPITREYARLSSPPGFCDFHVVYHHFGFGKSAESNQYKVVGLNTTKCECHIYTIGEGEGEGVLGGWRRISCAALTATTRLEIGFAHVEGNLHWLQVVWGTSGLVVWCLDLEREVFTSFPGPPTPSVSCASDHHHRQLSVLDGCLCYFEDETYGGSVWLMRDYSTKSWTKPFCISNYRAPGCRDSCFLYPLRLSTNDSDSKEETTMLICDGRRRLLFVYSFSTNTFRHYGGLPLHIRPLRGGGPILLTPSFRPLTTQLPLPLLLFHRY